jgi:hypothetical protein
MVHTARDICPTKVLKMAIRATHDVLMKHRGLTLKQGPVVSVARHTFAIVDAEHGRMTGAASAIQRGMRLRQGAWIDRLFPKADDIVVPKLQACVRTDEQDGDRRRRSQSQEADNAKQAGHSHLNPK